MVNTTRYEIPFSFVSDMYKWDMLNHKLKEMFDKKQIIAISNNRVGKMNDLSPSG